MSCLKAGVAYADRVTTVSKTYAQEIQTLLLVAYVLCLVLALSSLSAFAQASGGENGSSRSAIEDAAGGGWGRTFYVDYRDGNDANAGTSELAPYKHSPGDSAFVGTVVLQSGDTVLFKRGVTYSGVVTTQAPSVTYTVSDTWGTGDAVIDGSGQDAALIVHHSNTKVDGGPGRNLVLTGAIRHALIWHFGNSSVNGCFYGRLKVRDIAPTNMEGIGIKIGGNSVAYLNNEIAYNEISRAYSAGIKISGSGTSHILIHDNVLEGNGIQTGEHTQINISSNDGAGVQNTRVYNNVIRNGCAAKDCNGININNANHEVYNNDIYGHPGSGIALNPGYNKNYAGVLKIYGNRIHDQGKYGLIITDTDASRNAVIYNNVFFNNAVYDINLSGGSPSHNGVYNNTLYHSARGIIVQGGKGNVIRNNIIWPVNDYPIVDNGNSSIDTNLFAGNATPRGTNALVGDPLFVDAAAADFRLQAGSPCIDTGADLSVFFNFDHIRSPRPVGTAWDIGAHEHGGTTLAEQALAQLAPPESLLAASPVSSKLVRFSSVEIPATQNQWSFTDEFLAPVDSGLFGTMDLAKTIAASEGWGYAEGDEVAFFGDKERRVRLTENDEYLVWDAVGVRSFAVTVYAREPGVAAEVEVAVSIDGTAWTKVNPVAFGESASAGTGWHRMVLSGAVAAGRDIRYIRVTIPASVPADSLQLGSVTLSGVS